MWRSVDVHETMKRIMIGTDLMVIRTQKGNSDLNEQVVSRDQPGPSAGVWPEASCGVFLCEPSLSQSHTPAIATSDMQIRVFTSEFSQRVCKSKIFLVCNLV